MVTGEMTSSSYDQLFSIVYDIIIYYHINEGYYY